MLITLKVHQCHTSHSLHSMSLQDSNIRKSHNCIEGREMSYVITDRAAVDNLILFSLYKIFVGGSCSNRTNHSHETPPFGRQMTASPSVTNGSFVSFSMDCISIADRKVNSSAFSASTLGNFCQFPGMTAVITITTRLLLRPDHDLFNYLTDPGDSEMPSTRFNSQSSPLK